MSTFSIIKKYPILYKKNKSGKVRLWSILAIFDNIDNTYWINIEYGQKDGKITYIEKEVKESKTSIEQQTILICDKTFRNKKEKEGYSENIEN